MRPIAPQRLAILLAAAVLGTLAAAARADEGPVVLGKHERAPVLTLDPFHGSLGLNGYYAYDSLKGSGTPTTSTDTLIQEQLNLSTGGGIVSKNLVDWHASVTGGLTQEWFESPGQSSTNNGVLEAYDLSASILKTTEFPVSLFAQQAQQNIDRSFAGMLQNTVSTYGALFAYRSPKLPTTLRIYHIETTQADLGGAIQYSDKENNLDFSTQYEPADRQNLTLNYHYSTVEQDNPGTLTNAYDTQNLDATHTWGLDANGRFLLTSTFNYDEQTGESAYTHTRLDERLRYRYSENFETFIDYALDQQQYVASTSLLNRFTGGFTHRLFESLTTTGIAGASQTDRSFSGTSASTSTTDDVFATLAFNYIKKVPLGDLGANLSLGYDQTNNGAIGSTQQVIGDVQTFPPGLQPIILARPGVNPSTVKVFNAAGNHQYLANTDYTVHEVGNTVQIDQVPGGALTPGQTVKLNYDIDPLPGYTATTTNFSTGLRYDIREGWLNGFGVYLQYSQQDQTISSTSPGSIVPDNVRDTLVGAEYHIWKLTLRAEQENRESTLAPSDSTRFAVTYLDRLGARTTVAINAYETFVTYPSTGPTDSGGDTTFTSIDARLDYQISRELRALFTVRWQNNEDSRFGNTMGFEDQGELRWNVRQTEFYVLARHTYLTSTGSDNTSFLFQFGITRQF